MSDQTLISYAQNGEDVVLWRALGHVSHGRYVDVGACDPVDLSVTKALYDRGWRGIDIDAVPDYADRLRDARPGNEVVQAAITDLEVEAVTFHQLVGTGLSTLLDDTAAEHEKAGFEREDISVTALTLDEVCERSTLLGSDLHLLKVDVEGAEPEVLRSFDLGRWRPWVVVVEATRPLSNEPSFAQWDPLLVEAGYVFTLFDGLSRFYVSPDHLEIVPALSYPACALDDYVPVRQHLQDVRVDQLTQDVAHHQQATIHWRNEAVGYWANAMARVQRSEDAMAVAHREVQKLRRQMTRTRERLDEARQDRKRLRGRVQRMSAKVTRLESRNEKVHPPAVTVGGRVRAGVRRVIGS